MAESDATSRTAKDYSDILDFSLYTKCVQKENEMDASLEAVLMRLDEFYGMLEMIRNDSTKLCDDVLQTFRVEREKLRLVYKRIDELEKFVEIVKNDCQAMEVSLKASEDEFGTVATIKKAITGFKVTSLWKKTPSRDTGQSNRTDFQAPAVFQTSDYITPKETND